MLIYHFSFDIIIPNKVFCIEYIVLYNFIYVNREKT